VVDDMTDVIDRFKTEYQDYHGISADRAKQQRRLLADFRSSLDGRELSEVTSADLQSFAGQLMGRNYHVNTVRKKLNMLRAFFSWAYAANVITADQYLKLKAVKNPRGSTGQTQPNPYSRAELQAFWAALDTALPKLPKQGRGSQALTRWIRGKGPWARVWRHALRLQVDCMVRLALDLGLRRSEIFGLSVNDLHYDNEYIVIRGKADPNTGIVKVREVPYTITARDAIKTWLEFRALMRPGHDSPWVSCYGRASTHPMWATRFDTLLQDVVGPEWRWHRFRHTAATEWLRSGMELATVSRLLGHATLQQTLCYAEIAKADLATAVGRHEAAFNQAVRHAA
jgi:site-specific recombinase XerD